MISFDGLNIVVGALGAASAYAIIKYYLKRKMSLAILTPLLVATFLVSFYLSSLLFRGWYIDWYINAEINQNPLMSTVKKYYPTDYHILIKNAEQQFKSKEGKEIIIAQSYALTNRIFLLSLQNATENEINDYVHTTLALYQKMLKQDPNFIIKFEHGDPALSLDFNYLMDDVQLRNYLKRTLNVRKAIIQASSQHAIQHTDPNVGLALLKIVMSNLANQYGNEAVLDTFSETKNNFPVEIKAQVITQFFQELANLDSKNKIMVVRYIGLMTAQAVIKKP